MKKLFIVANWKSNKTINETEKWLHDFSGEFKRNPFSLDHKEVIVSPSFTLLEHSRYCASNLNLPIELATQDISPFDEGAYTGEINAKQIREFADYVIIGHSERRKNFNESDEMLSKKVELANKYGLTPIFCVQGKETQIPSDSPIIAYEPIDAIGTGHPDTAENAEDIASFFKRNHGVSYVLYGGSVTSKNVKDFTQMPNIDGVLVGAASLDAKEFYEIIQNA